MGDEHRQLSETDSVDCHLQQVGMGSLICRAAKQTGEGTTNEVTPETCFNCVAGRVFREVGCDAVSPIVSIYPHMGGADLDIRSLFCKIRKRDTTLEYCQTCGLAQAETTRETVTTARGLFQAHGFYAAYKDIEKAREAIRDGNFENAVTRSISCLESVMRTCYEKMGQDPAGKHQVTDLWKATRELLDFNGMDPTKATETLLNSLSGVVFHLGGLRNALGDAHGRGATPPAVSENIAELAINTASALSTAILRRFNEMKEPENG